MSVRATIIANLIAQLETIQAGATYATTVADVRYDVLHSQQTNVGPGKVIVNVDDKGDGEITHTGASGKTLLSMTIDLRAQIVGEAYRTPMYQVASDWVDDIRKLIAAPISLGANARYARVAGTPTIGPSENDVLVDLTLEIVYWRS